MMENSRDIKQLITERIRLHASDVFGQENLLSLRSTIEAHACVDPFLNKLVVTLAASIPGILEEHISVHHSNPVDWWQAFRQRWLPGWWLKKHPVKMDTIDIEQDIFKAVCPHVKIREEGPHLIWMLEQQDS